MIIIMTQRFDKFKLLKILLNLKLKTFVVKKIGKEKKLNFKFYKNYRFICFFNEMLYEEQIIKLN